MAKRNSPYGESGLEPTKLQTQPYAQREISQLALQHLQAGSGGLGITG
jgi:hypothetical protein